MHMHMCMHTPSKSTSTNALKKCLMILDARGRV